MKCVPNRSILCALVLWLTLGVGCSRESTSAAPATASGEAVQAAASIPVPEDHVPAYALAEGQRYRDDFLRKNAQSASDLRWRFFYDAEENACLEVTVTGKAGYTWDTPTWIGMRWSGGGGQVGNGEMNYTLTKKKADAAQYRLEERRKEAAFRELEEIVLGVAQAYDYDFAGAYGQSVKYRRAETRLAVCDGYADAVQRAFAGHPLVASVEKWAGHKHAWNVVCLKDGRRLYCDATWYDGNSVDEEGFVVEVPQRDPVALTFDVEEFNSLGGAVDTATGKKVAVHFAWRGVQQSP